MTNHKTIELLNTTSLEFEPLNDEWREYDYAVDGKIVTLRIEQPRYINIHPVHGAHRVLDADGVSHYMPGNWLPRVGLRWKVNEGEPHFNFTVAPTGNEDAQPEVCDACGYAEDGAEADDVPAFMVPADVNDLFQRLGAGGPFATEELEEAARFFRVLEGEITR